MRPRYIFIEKKKISKSTRGTYFFADDYRTIRAARNSRIVSEREKNRERAARLSAAAENKARLRNATRRARSPTTFLYGKDGSEIATTRIWVSMHCGATLLTQSAAPPHRCGEEAAFTLTKIDTLSDRLLSSQLHLQDYNRAIWIAPRYRNATPSTHPMISHESLEMESLQLELSNWNRSARC